MSIPPLAIVQMRMGSTRLPGKMLLPLAGKPLWWHAWNAACDAVGQKNAIAAMPASEENDELAESCRRRGAIVFRWDGPENDVLGRFHACAHLYRWHPDTVIVRITPDDPRKEWESIRGVIGGSRLPVEIGGEAFTLAMLDEACEVTEAWLMDRDNDFGPREHITNALFDVSPPPAPPGIWTVDTPEDYEAMKRIMEQ